MPVLQTRRAADEARAGAVLCARAKEAAEGISQQGRPRGEADLGLDAAPCRFWGCHIIPPLLQPRGRYHLPSRSNIHLQINDKNQFG